MYKALNKSYSYKIYFDLLQASVIKLLVLFPSWPYQNEVLAVSEKVVQKFIVRPEYP